MEVNLSPAQDGAEQQDNCHAGSHRGDDVPVLKAMPVEAIRPA
jgi:hypothetical protein